VLYPPHDVDIRLLRFAVILLMCFPLASYLLLGYLIARYHAVLYFGFIMHFGLLSLVYGPVIVLYMYAYIPFHWSGSVMSPMVMIS